MCKNEIYDMCLVSMKNDVINMRYMVHPYCFFRKKEKHFKYFQMLKNLKIFHYAFFLNVLNQYEKCIV